MNGKLTVKILTPVGSAFNAEATMVLVPASEGEMGILPEHVSMIFKISPGVVKVYSDSKLLDTFFVFGGFGKIHKNELFLLVDKVTKVEDLNVSQARSDLLDLDKQILEANDQKILASIESQAIVARKIIEVSEHKH